MMKINDVTNMFNKTYLELCIDSDTGLGKVYKSTEATDELISLIDDRIKSFESSNEYLRSLHYRGLYRAKEFSDAVYNFRSVVHDLDDNEVISLRDSIYPEILYIDLIATIRNTLKARNQNYTMRAVASEIQSYLDMRSYDPEYLDEVCGVSIMEYNPVFISVSDYFRKDPDNHMAVSINLDDIDIIVCRVLGYVNRINTTIYSAHRIS